MKRNHITIISLLAIPIICFASCKKFLDVKPEDKVLETQLFSTQQGTKSVLNGLYISLANNKLYGENLTLSTLEILAQRYNMPSTHALNKIASYAYRDEPTAGKLETIWTGAYSAILNVNAFLENVDKYKGVLDVETEKIYKGEALAMRALLHFDLLRLFGPRYNTVDSTNTSLPYYQATESTINPLLPASQFIDKIISDLNDAEVLLADDLIITNGVSSTVAESDVDFIRDNRNYRLNYYAVKGLKARVYLYRGDKENALRYAREIINVANKFPWTTPQNALSEKQNPDRVFSTEMLFGVMNTQLYSRYTDLFDPSMRDENIYAPITARLNAIYEANENDYRFNLNWAVPSTGVKGYKTFYKYADIVDKAKTYRFTIPLLKISEMYYIASESEPIVAEGVNYLNVVRTHRGLPNLAPTANLQTELQKEYQKEFYGEGQLFYFYKRRNITSIPNGSASSGNVTVNYDIPMPQSELRYR